MRKDKGAMVVKMVCPKCGKDFGLGILKVHEGVGQPHSPLEIVQGADPITFDEVLDVHELLKGNKAIGQ